LNGTLIRAQLNTTATVSFCDFFEIGHGYTFTVADSGIGLVILTDRIGGALDIYYRDLSQASLNYLAFNWTELASLSKDYSRSQCSSSNPASNSSAVCTSSNSTSSSGSSVQVVQGGDVW
jgi:hypothetical protein